MFRPNKFILFLTSLALLFINNTESTTNQNSENREPRIVGGFADRNHFIKYQAVLHDGYRDFCGGTIIAERYILTAAHCIIGPNDTPSFSVIYTIVGGGNTLFHETKDIVPTVEKMFIPAMFNGSRGAAQIGNIAVLKLDRPVRLKTNPDVEKVDLPQTFSDGTYDTYEGQMATIAGFGANVVAVKPKDEKKYNIKFGEKLYPSELLVGKSIVMNQQECENVCDGSFEIHSSHMCARMGGEGHRGICKGDGGNGLILDGVVIAVANFGHDLCYEGHRTTPGIYTRVSYFMPFIKSAMSDAVNDDVRVFHKSK